MAVDECAADYAGLLSFGNRRYATPMWLQAYSGSRVCP
jgi:hypothetical protein